MGKKLFFRATSACKVNAAFVPSRVKSSQKHTKGTKEVTQCIDGIKKRNFEGNLRKRNQHTS